jgi:hypothetical protein
MRMRGINPQIHLIQRFYQAGRRRGLKDFAMISMYILSNIELLAQSGMKVAYDLWRIANV